MDEMNAIVNGKNLLDNPTNMTQMDHLLMMDYVRSKEYLAGLRDAYLVLDNSKDVEQGLKRLQMMRDTCESMIYSIIEKTFAFNLQ